MREAVVALVTLERFFTRMNSLVYLQIRTLSEAFVTFVTLERGFTRMNSLVFFELRMIREAFLRQITVVRTYSCREFGFKFVLLELSLKNACYPVYSQHFV